jgi:flagellar L-ring protein precursor FlgH
MAPLEPSAGAIYPYGPDLALFEDIKARRQGDLLTIVLVERTDAQKSADTSLSRDTDIDIPAPVILGQPVTHNGVPVDTRLQSSTDFDGNGDSAQSNALTGSITVTVAEVLPNGTLVVQGEKWIGINRGEEYIRVRGIVRPVDIRADNTVLSTQIGNVEIAYGGTGELASANRMGWLGRFFTSVIWPL